MCTISQATDFLIDGAVMVFGAGQKSNKPHLKPCRLRGSYMTIFSKTRNGFAVLWMMVGPVAAHEFFIEPQMYSVPADAEIVASLAGLGR